MIYVRDLTGEDLNYFSAFERITGVFPADFLLQNETLIFIVESEELGKAIGKKGLNIARLKQVMNKRVLIIANSGDAVGLAKNFFSNIRFSQAEIQNGKITIYVDDRDRGLAIGKDGDRIKLAKQLFKKKFNLDAELKTRRMAD